jgi:hypothetical protein
MVILHLTLAPPFSWLQKKKFIILKTLRANVYWNCLLQVLHAQFKRKHSLNISSERKEKHSPSFIQIFITNTK